MIVVSLVALVISLACLCDVSRHRRSIERSRAEAAVYMDRIERLLSDQQLRAMNERYGLTPETLARVEMANVPTLRDLRGEGE